MVGPTAGGGEAILAAMSDQPGWLAPPPPTPPPPPPPPVEPVPEVTPAPALWVAGGGRDYRWIPAAGGLLLVVVVGWSLWSIFGQGARTQHVTPTPTPTPAGVEYARASNFWNKAALPALADVNRSARAINTNCKGKLSTACRSAIEATDQKLQFALTVIKEGDIPACITTHITRFKSDLLAMDGGLQVALNGYKAGDLQLVDQGLSQFRENAIPVSSDAADVTNDVKNLCN